MRFKLFLSLFSLVLGFFAVSAQAKASWMPWEINWDRSDSQNELIMPMICDDAYYVGLHVIVPGILNQDFDLEIVNDDGTCRVKTQSTSVRNEQQVSVLRIENKGQCEITIHQKSGASRTGRKAEAFLTDAC